MPPPRLITVEEFFRPPRRTRVTISPDGTRIAYLAPWQDRLNVWTENLDGPPEPRPVTTDTRRSVHTYHWTDDPRWLLYEQDRDGDENWHLHRVDLDDPEAPAVDLTPFPPGVRALGYQPAAPGRAILRLNHRDPARFDLYELDISTAGLTLIARNDGRVEDWIRSGTGELYALVRTDSGARALTGWDAERGPTHTVKELDEHAWPYGIFPMQPTPDGTGVWIGAHRDGGLTGVARLDLTTGEETETDSHPRLDLDTRAQVFPTLPPPLILDRRTGELIGARYLGDRQTINTVGRHTPFADVLRRLESLCDGDLSTLSGDESGQRWVAAFTHDRHPGRTYLYDRRTGEARLLSRPFPHLAPEELAPMRPVALTSRDGLTLPSYLTLPLGVEPVGLPLVLLFHGGPWARDSWGYHPVVQLLANRGYAVLQVNFRGSTGYGTGFTQAAVGEFAGKMHDDLLDGVDWAVREGYADPGRVGVLGASYGGYAALVGVTFTPDVFAAAVDLVGISDLAPFLRSLPEFTRPALADNWFRFVGDPDDPEQAADMRARSPLTRADRIRTPLMVVQGANDPRVVRDQSDRIVEAARAHGASVEYRVLDDEGHSFVNPGNNEDLHLGIERFFATHLGGRTQGQRPAQRAR
ncbi:S9 family peptidase [Streptomyces sp. NPDC088785]|uniref:S9 family peptidase n=1 Tax=Streptomyces sp. NPDC088785 TaxID=3365897 RepID=UPI0038098FA6